ncbi:glycosyltransferase [Butyrivibrio sp. JL13D10]|uniref:glycosyltransferase n=1 Tax=Butyrivibrio sp. JL13D10 TaxID=3236815 RepID=UPI0038B4E168
MKENNPKVSIIVPVYNVENYLEKCLDTLTGQTLKDIEILAVNDGSTDSSLSILEKYSKKDSRITILNKENGGLSDARNFAFSHINGEYVGFIDSDDFVDLNMYEIMHKTAIAEGAEVVECNLHHTYDNTEDTEIGKHITDKKEILMNGRSVVWNKIYKADWLLSTGVQFPKGLIYEDVNFYSKLVPFINKICYVDDPFVHYVQRSSSINNHQTLRTMQILEVLDDIYSFYEEKGFLTEYKDALEFLYTRILLCSSLKRMSQIEDASDRKKALDANWNKLITTFPNWRSGKYLREYTGKNSKFMKAMNPATYKLAGILLHYKH